jgi:tRNA(fMet)-specific endonuclease VapC
LNKSEQKNVATFLVDTNIISYSLKGDSRALLYRGYLNQQSLAISLITVAELKLWGKQAKWGSQRVANLESYLRQGFNIIGVNWELCDSWAAVRLECQLAGRPLAPHDAWIAATALQYDLPLVTHNAKDFAPITNLQMITAAE